MFSIAFLPFVSHTPNPLKKCARGKICQENEKGEIGEGRNMVHLSYSQFFIINDNYLTIIVPDYISTELMVLFKDGQNVLPI